MTGSFHHTVGPRFRIEHWAESQVRKSARGECLRRWNDPQITALEAYVGNVSDLTLSQLRTDPDRAAVQSLLLLRNEGSHRE